MESMKKLPECELAVMMTVWHSGETVTSAYIAANLEEAGKWNASTLLNFLSRLEKKGFLCSEKQGKTNVYTPLIDEETYLRCESRSIFQRLYGNSLKRMLTALYDGEGLSDRDAAELEQFLQEKTAETGQKK